MKALLTIAAVAMMFTSAKADTGSGYVVLRESGSTVAYLSHCGGTAVLKQTYVGNKRLPLLVISGSQNCSNIVIDGQNQGKLDRGYAEVVVYERAGYNVHTVTIESNSKKTVDTIRVESYGQSSPSHQQPSANIVFDFGWGSTVFGNSKWARLNECGGLVEAAVENNQVNLKFSDVSSCSKFDILGANGESVNYSTKSLQKTRSGAYAGSFTIPKRYIDAGSNAVRVILKSNSGKHDEVILIRFKSF